MEKMTVETNISGCFNQEDSAMLCDWICPYISQKLYLLLKRNWKIIHRCDQKDNCREPFNIK